MYKIKHPYLKWPRGDWAFAALLVFSPVVNAWYLIWLLVFATLYPSRWAWVASVTFLMSYVTGINLVANNEAEAISLYQLPLSIHIAEYLIILAVWLSFDTKILKRLLLRINDSIQRLVTHKT